MPEASVKIEGAEEVLRKLKALPDKLSKGLVRKSLRSGAKVVLGAAKANAPVRTGALRRSLKVRVGRRQKDRVSFLVQTRKGDFAGDEFYGAFQEFGWKRGKRKSYSKTYGSKENPDSRPQIPGKHFIEQAYEQTKTQAVTTIVETLRAGLDAEVQSA